MHYCVGQIEAITLSLQNNTCEVVSQSTTCTSDYHGPDCEQNAAKVGGKDCCVEHSIQVAGQHNPAQIASISIPYAQLVMVLNTVVSLLNTAPTVDTYSCIEYPPPAANRDITILIQSLLI
ncbi:MAG: hypothetical protein HYX66_07670 [Ignavibacteria bacterium]|nr:hypothetical protein [Ignavibacteria bacterium]